MTEYSSQGQAWETEDGLDRLANTKWSSKDHDPLTQTPRKRGFYFARVENKNLDFCNARKNLDFCR